MPPEEIIRPKNEAKSETVNIGLNMYFKKHQAFSQDPGSAGGELAANQTCLSMPWGFTGCPAAK